MQKGSEGINTTSIPAPVGQASGPPLDGWHWAMIARPPSGTEWPGHSHPEAGSCKRDLLCPAHDRHKEEMWCYDNAVAQKQKSQDTNCSTFAKNETIKAASV